MVHDLIKSLNLLDFEELKERFSKMIRQKMRMERVKMMTIMKRTGSELRM